MTQSWLLLLIIAFLIACGSPYKGPKSDHFDGETFSNLEPILGDRGLWDVIKWKWTTDAAEWPEWIETNYGKRPPATVSKGHIRYTVINHATVLIQADGINILTDPIWSKRTSPVSWAGPKRVRNPGLRWQDLPSIHIVAISHNHYDHMDLPTLLKLEKEHRPVFIVGLGSKEFLQGEGLNRIIELDWWQKTEVMGLPITFVPAQHFSGRGLFDRNEMLWGGFVFSVGYGNVFFAGDTGYGKLFAAIRERFKHIDIAFLPIGAYEPRYFMAPVHVNPAEAVQAHIDLQSHHSVGMHFGTFQLTDEAIDQPAIDLKKALDEKLIPSMQFVVPQFGVGTEF